MNIKKHKRTVVGKVTTVSIPQFDSIDEAIEVLGTDSALQYLNRAYKIVQLNMESALKLRVDSDEKVKSFLRSAVRSCTTEAELTEMATKMGCTPQTLHLLIEDSNDGCDRDSTPGS